ncbi:MAG: MATE family efflux transporter, partial [Lachnospiraceae bacterium]|nr:MATE family efflux transporter [Lachnospiraceae bacterium]
LFNSEQNIQMQEIAVNGLKLYFLAIPFIGINIVTTMYFSAVEKSTEGQIISLLRGFLLTIPMACILSYMGGLFGVWISVPVTEAIVCLIACIFWRKYTDNLIT